MADNILEYVLTDVYFRLFWEAGSTFLGKPRKVGTKWIYPGEGALIHDYDRSVLEIPEDGPDYIIASQVNLREVHLTQVKSRVSGFIPSLPSPDTNLRVLPSEVSEQDSVSIQTLKLVWGQDSKTPHRLRGPAAIQMVQVRYNYLDNELNDEMKFSHVTFEWRQNGKFKREGGPHTIMLRDLKAVFRDDELASMSFGDYETKFNKIDGKTFGDSNIKRFMAGHPEVKIDPFHMENFFESPLDEMVFITDIKAWLEQQKP